MQGVMNFDLMNVLMKALAIRNWKKANGFRCFWEEESSQLETWNILLYKSFVLLLHVQYIKVMQDTGNEVQEIYWNGLYRHSHPFIW